MCKDINGDSDDEANGDDYEDDEDDDKVSESESEGSVGSSVFGSLKDTNDENDYFSDIDDDETIHKSESNTQTLTENVLNAEKNEDVTEGDLCNSPMSDSLDNFDDKSDQTPDSNQSNSNFDDNLAVVNTKLNDLKINSAKLKSQLYEQQSLFNPTVSEHTELVVSRALSKHENPVPCPVCKKMMKNEKGVKLHMSKKH